MSDALPENAPQPSTTTRASEDPLPPWVVVGEAFYGHPDWRIESVVGQWIRVSDTKSRSDSPEEAWIYLPTGVVYGSTTLLRRTQHGFPTVSR